MQSVAATVKINIHLMIFFYWFTNNDAKNNITLLFSWAYVKNFHSHLKIGLKLSAKSYDKRNDLLLLAVVVTGMRE